MGEAQVRFLLFLLPSPSFFTSIPLPLSLLPNPDNPQVIFPRKRFFLIFKNTHNVKPSPFLFLSFPYSLSPPPSVSRTRTLFPSILKTRNNELNNSKNDYNHVKNQRR